MPKGWCLCSILFMIMFRLWEKQYSSPCHLCGLTVCGKRLWFVPNTQHHSHTWVYEKVCQHVFLCSLWSAALWHLLTQTYIVRVSKGIVWSCNVTTGLEGSCVTEKIRRCRQKQSDLQLSIAPGKSKGARGFREERSPADRATSSEDCTTLVCDDASQA